MRLDEITRMMRVDKEVHGNKEGAYDKPLLRDYGEGDKPAKAEE